MEYSVVGKVTIMVEMEVHADNPQSAELLAKNVLNESYNLNVIGYSHNPDTDVKFDLNTDEV